MELTKAYEPKLVEDKIYKLWQESGFFNPDNLPERHKKPYTIVIPPPNVTGSLHMGHALQHTIHDIVIRQKRMQGFKTLWLPGTDHAGISTQNVVEKNLRKEGILRWDLGKEEFLKKVWEWKEKYGNIILDQIKKLGASCDWSRTRFTMDPEYVKAVEKVFLHYYKKGWIYQGERVVNWCTRCGTSLSDLELEYKEELGKLWYLKYPIVGTDDFVVVATTRPETMLGDTAVAVNPKDKRYKNLVGKKVLLPIQNREIPIISDIAIDLNFGTGAVKVTPANDPLDWEIGLRHKLPVIKIVNERGKMTKEAGICEGLKMEECRQKVLALLQEQNLIEKIEDYTHAIPHCYRCNSIIEPLPSKQWFLKMQKLAKLATDAVKKGKVKFIQKKFEKPYFDWLKNVRDWCISRQIWWGHKIPIEGVDDVLDTWFSSALWPFATLGWPKETKDLKTFYPTDTLITARDIINLWVTRMIFSGLEFIGKEPFKKVFINPTVLAKDGQRMSKSLGTGVDPLGLIEKYGADATRFGLIFQLMGGQDIKFSEDNIMMGKKFCNKIWNASRFVLMQIGNSKLVDLKPKSKTAADKNILKKLSETIRSADKDFKKFEFGQAAHTIYDFFWHDFCDIYIEASKNQQDNQTKNILFQVLLNSLKLLHPFIPFVTEEIYQNLPIENKVESLMIESWPK